MPTHLFIICLPSWLYAVDENRGIQFFPFESVPSCLSRVTSLNSPTFWGLFLALPLLAFAGSTSQNRRHLFPPRPPPRLALGVKKSVG